MKRKTCHAAICLGLLGSMVMQSAQAQQQPLDRGWQGGDQTSRGAAQQSSANQPRLQGAAVQTDQAGTPQPRVPFVLTPQEEARVDQILHAWEQQTGTIKTYKCEFTRWEYGTLGFGQSPEDKNRLLTLSTGELKYSAPDKGLFKVTSIKVYNSKSGKYENGGPENLEHWVCDGKSVFQIDHKDKTRTERPLPPEMQGVAISDGPLPFVFGAKAAKLKERYWIREIKSNDPDETIWLEAFPRYQADAANFRYVQVIIGRKDLMLKGIQMFRPSYDPQQGNESRTAFQFEKTSFNGALANVFTDFVAPTVPLGYKKIVLQPGPEQPPANNASSVRPDARSAQSTGRTAPPR